MTISSSRSRASSGFSLLEILLAIGLCAILAAVSVPTMVGWMAEHRLRMQADDLIKLVQSAKLRAEKTAQAQVVLLLAPGENPPAEAAPNIHFLQERAGTVWSLRRFGQGERDGAPSFIEIDRSGWISPVSFRVAAGGKYMEYQIDFLTGHAREVASSL